LIQINNAGKQGMAEALTDVLRYICRLAGSERGNEPSDGDLLQQFVAERDEGVFARILERHGPLVFGVCRQVLGNPHDAEDAFQATFLVLARKAAFIRKQEALAAWLHRVALNIARTARSSTAQRRVHERQAVLMSQSSPVDEVALRDWRPVIHEEVDRLPEKYRVGVVLCYLEGKTHEEAARQLGWPLGTVKGRLARARDLLRTRLARRGLALSVPAFAVALTQKGASAAVPVTLLGHTLRAAVPFAGGGSIPTGVVSVQALALAKAALQTMTATKLLHLFVWILAVGVITLGTVLGAGLGGQGVKQDNSDPASKPSPMKQQEIAPPALIQKDKAKGIQVTLASTQKEVRALAPIRPGRKEAENPADVIPLGPVARMGSLRFRHGGRVSSLAYLAKGKLLASGGYVGTTWDAHGRVRVWKARSGEELRHYRLQGLAQVAASPDGTILAGASAGDGTVYLWDAASGREIRRLKGSRGFDGRSCGLAFSPDGNVLALAGHALHVWHVDTGKLVHFENDEDHSLLQLAFSGDGKILAMTRVDETGLQLLDAKSWKKRASFPSKRGIMGFALPDHKTLLAVERATAEENSSAVILFDLATGKQLRQFDAQGGPVYSLALSADGKMLASFSADKAIHIWEMATGKRQQELPADKYAHGALAFAPDQQTLAWANSAGQIQTWNLATGKAIHSGVGHQGVVSSVALSADGKTLFSAGTDRTIRIWDARTGKELRSFGAHLGPVAALALSPNGKILASVSPADGRVRQWQLPRPREMRSFPASATYCEIAWLPDSATLAVRRIDDKAVTFYDAASGNIIRKIEGTLPPNVMAYPDRHIEAAHTGGFLIVSPDGKTLATCSNFCHPSFQLWETATGKKLVHPAVEVPDKAAAMAAVFSPDSKTVFTATYRTIRQWDVAEGKQLQQFIAHEGKITGLAMSPDGKTLAIVGSDPTIRLWEVASRTERHRLEGHEGQVTSLSWSADSQTLASGSADGTALVWDLRK
jgi:RNA polymerase sigma factor (sigma-70 family)